MKISPNLSRSLLLLTLLGVAPRFAFAQQRASHHLSAAQAPNLDYHMVEDGTLLKSNLLGNTVLHSDRGQDTVFILDSGTYTLGKHVQRLGFTLIGEKNHETILDLTPAVSEYDPAEPISSEKNKLKLGTITFMLRGVAFVQIGAEKIALPAAGQFPPEVAAKIRSAFEEAKAALPGGPQQTAPQAASPH